MEGALVSIIVFFGMHVIPGDVAQMILVADAAGFAQFTGDVGC